MKKWVKGIIIWIAIILLIFGIPLLINILFKHNFGVKWIQSEWSAGEALSFYGALLGGFITLFGVAITLKNENKKRINEEAILYKPILTFEGIDENIKCLIGNVYIGYPISVTNDDEDNMNLFFEQQGGKIRKCRLDIKNSGRGETYNTVIEDYNIKCNWDDISRISGNSSGQYIGEVIKDSYLGIDVHLPDYLILPKNYKDDLEMILTINIDYSDMFNINRYRLKLHIFLLVIPQQEQKKHPNIYDDKYHYTSVKYEIRDIMPEKQFYSFKEKKYINDYFMYHKD